ncbi:hypothetical protein MC885_018040 [Smutsia gigantea]|nr:hypothetical protein MC885_018040 [Smutsia gigantea]
MLVRSVLLAVQALQLVGALDLPGGSCTFEESTCGFDSMFEFLPWILNEEVPAVGAEVLRLRIIGGYELGLMPEELPFKLVIG